jgi:hypothetical protein
MIYTYPKGVWALMLKTSNPGEHKKQERELDYGNTRKTKGLFVSAYRLYNLDYNLNYIIQIII